MRIEQNESGLLEIMQEGLIDHVIEDVGIVNEKTTPPEAKPLVKDTDGEVTHL